MKGMRQGKAKKGGKKARPANRSAAMPMKPPMKPMMGGRERQAMAQGMGGGGMMGMPGAGALDRLMQG